MTVKEDCIEALDNAMDYPVEDNVRSFYYLLKALVLALLYIGEQIRDKKLGG